MQPYCAVVTVTTAGSPVQVPVPADVGALAVMIKALASNAGGTVYVGRSATFDRIAGTDLIVDLNGFDATFTVMSEDGSDRIYPFQYWLDATNNGDKLIVTWWVG